MSSDPFAQVVEPTMLDCSDPNCTGIHDLGQLPDESRADWIARLRAMVAADSRYDNPGERVPLAISLPAPALVDCERCGEPRWHARACQPCRLRTRLERGLLHDG